LGGEAGTDWTSGGGGGGGKKRFPTPVNGFEGGGTEKLGAFGGEIKTSPTGAWGVHTPRTGFGRGGAMLNFGGTGIGVGALIGIFSRGLKHKNKAKGCWGGVGNIASVRLFVFRHKGGGANIVGLNAKLNTRCSKQKSGNSLGFRFFPKKKKKKGGGSRGTPNTPTQLDWFDENPRPLPRGARGLGKGGVPARVKGDAPPPRDVFFSFPAKNHGGGGQTKNQTVFPPHGGALGGVGEVCGRLAPRAKLVFGGRKKQRG